MLRKTKKYDLFELHEFNRPIKHKPWLLESMARVGFMPSSPLHVIPSPNGNGKFLIIRGHHRFHYAKRLGIPVWYVIDESNTDIHSLERDSGHSWSISDFAESHERAGDNDYMILMGFKRKHGLTLGSAAALVGGESAGSGNKIRDIKSGKFKCGDMTHANEVVVITDFCRKIGLGFATSTAFVAAVSMVLRIPEFNPAVFQHRLSLHHGMLMKRGTKKEYLEEIDALYNHQAKGNRMPTKFRAIQVARERNVTFCSRKSAKKTESN